MLENLKEKGSVIVELDPKEFALSPYVFGMDPV